MASDTAAVIIAVDDLDAVGAACRFDQDGKAVDVPCCQGAAPGEVQCALPASNAVPTALVGNSKVTPLCPGDVACHLEEGAFHYFRYSNSCIGRTLTPKQGLSGHEACLAWLRGDRFLRGLKEPNLGHKMMAEALGTGLIVLFGCGSVCAAVLTGAQQGLWQVAVVWGFGIAIAIHCTGSISGAHLNPAISLSFALLRPSDFQPSNIPAYFFAQLLGAIIAACINLLIFGGALSAFDAAKGISRGDEASVLTASCFGEYFPNPGFQYQLQSVSANGGTQHIFQKTGLQWDDDTVTVGGAFAVEAWGTAILAMVIFALTDERNKTLVRKELVPFFIGFAVSVLISLYAPLTQAGWNPARDFGPRLVAAVAGWGKVAIPGPRNGFWVYILGPMVGAPLGAAFYEFVVARGLGPRGSRAE